MVRIDGAVFGYRRVLVQEKDVSFAASILLRAKISARVNPGGEIIVRERDTPKMRALFNGKIEYSVSEEQGALGIIKRIKYKIGLVSALIFSVILLILSANIVWDVRVDGNEKIPDAAIAYALSENGFSIGDFWWSIDRSEVEASVLSSFDALSWININRRGSVAYLTVKEKEDGDSENEALTGYANVVAEFDCVIEEITVKSGQAAVKVGDSVKAGDLLISGIIVSESGTELCYAEGSVVGRVSDTLETFVKREHNRPISVEREVRSVDVKIFGFSLNIFKRYGKDTEECVIIEEISDFSLFGKCKLPIWVSVSCAVKEAYSVSNYTDEELVRVATSRLNSLTASKLGSSDLVRIRTFGEHTGDGYTMKNEIVFLKEVGKTLQFSASEE